MGKNSRLENRKKRTCTRKPRLGYYLIITDTDETEKNYFNGLRDSLSNEIKNNIVIKVLNTKTENLVERAKEYLAKEPQFYQVWIVFDRDKVVNFDSIIQLAIKNGVKVGWSNPCFEIWLSAYFGIMPNWMTSVECCDEFKKVFKKKIGKEYTKNSESLYKDLMKKGNEKDAIRIACMKLRQAQEKSHLPSKQCPASTVHYLVSEIRSKID